MLQVEPVIHSVFFSSQFKVNREKQHQRTRFLVIHQIFLDRYLRSNLGREQNTFSHTQRKRTKSIVSLQSVEAKEII